jgi:hypothetical protein
VSPPRARLTAISPGFDLETIRASVAAVSTIWRQLFHGQGGQPKAFVKVVETGSFTEAGRQLRLSRSAISTYVAELEHSLGGPRVTRARTRTGKCISIAPWPCCLS